MQYRALDLKLNNVRFIKNKVLKTLIFLLISIKYALISLLIIKKKVYSHECLFYFKFIFKFKFFKDN